MTQDAQPPPEGLPVVGASALPVGVAADVSLEGFVEPTLLPMRVHDRLLWGSRLLPALWALAIGVLAWQAGRNGATDAEVDRVRQVGLGGAIVAAIVVAIGWWWSDRRTRNIKLLDGRLPSRVRCATAWLAPAVAATLLGVTFVRMEPTSTFDIRPSVIVVTFVAASWRPYALLRRIVKTLSRVGSDSLVLPAFVFDLAGFGLLWWQLATWPDVVGSGRADVLVGIAFAAAVAFGMNVVVWRLLTVAVQEHEDHRLTSLRTRHEHRLLRLRGVDPTDPEVWWALVRRRLAEEQAAQQEAARREAAERDAAAREAAEQPAVEPRPVLPGEPLLPGRRAEPPVPSEPRPSAPPAPAPPPPEPVVAEEAEVAEVEVVEPVVAEPELAEPVVAQEVAEPVVAEPVVAEPVVAEELAEPVVAEPVVAEPVAAEPVAVDDDEEVGEPAVTEASDRGAATDAFVARFAERHGAALRKLGPSRSDELFARLGDRFDDVLGRDADSPGGDELRRRIESALLSGGATAGRDPLSSFRRRLGVEPPEEPAAEHPVHRLLHQAGDAQVEAALAGREGGVVEQQERMVPPRLYALEVARSAMVLAFVAVVAAVLFTLWRIVELSDAALGAGAASIGSVDEAARIALLALAVALATVPLWAATVASQADRAGTPTTRRRTNLALFAAAVACGAVWALSGRDDTLGLAALAIESAVALQAAATVTPLRRWFGLSTARHVIWGWALFPLLGAAVLERTAAQTPSLGSMTFFAVLQLVLASVVAVLVAVSAADIEDEIRLAPELAVPARAARS